MRRIRSPVENRIPSANKRPEGLCGQPVGPMEREKTVSPRGAWVAWPWRRRHLRFDVPGNSVHRVGRPRASGNCRDRTGWEFRRSVAGGALAVPTAARPRPDRRKGVTSLCELKNFGPAKVRLLVVRRVSDPCNLYNAFPGLTRGARRPAEPGRAAPQSHEPSRFSPSSRLVVMAWNTRWTR